MTYILMIWTVVAMAGDRFHQAKAMDWRPLGEFYSETNSHGFQNGKTAQQMCEDAAKQLGLKNDAYRCIRSK
jgi:hypothetical protein